MSQLIRTLTKLRLITSAKLNNSIGQKIAYHPSIIAKWKKYQSSSNIQHNVKNQPTYLTLPKYQIHAEQALLDKNVKLFKRILTSAPANYEWSWSDLIAISVRSGDISLFDISIETAPKDYYWRGVLDIALEAGQKDMFDCLMLYIKVDEDDWYDLTLSTMASGQIELFDYIRSFDPRYESWDYNELIRKAMSLNMVHLSNHIMTVAPLNYKWNWQSISYDLLRRGHLAAFSYISLTTPSNYRWNWYNLIIPTVELGDIKSFDYIIKLASSNHKWSLNLLAWLSLKNNHPSLFSHIYMMAPPDYQWWWDDFLFLAVESDNRKLFDYILSLAPTTDYNWHWPDHQLNLNDQKLKVVSRRSSGLSLLAIRLKNNRPNTDGKDSELSDENLLETISTILAECDKFANYRQLGNTSGAITLELLDPPHIEVLNFWMPTDRDCIMLGEKPIMICPKLPASLCQ